MVGMYSTKYQNSHIAESYISIGDDYVKKRVQPSRLKGKQIGTSINKSGHQGNFSLYEFKSDPYDNIAAPKFMKTQPLKQRKLGFGSHDASRTSEFSNMTRQEQWRVTLRKERDNELIRQDMQDKRSKTMPAPRSTKMIDDLLRARTAESGQLKLPSLFQATVPSRLFDIGRVEKGTTPTCHKCSRDTFFCKHRMQKQDDELRATISGPFDGNLTAMRLAPTDRVSSRMYGKHYGSPANATIRPAYGRKCLTKDFYCDTRGMGLASI